MFLYKIIKKMLTKNCDVLHILKLHYFSTCFLNAELKYIKMLTFISFFISSVCKTTFIYFYKNLSLMIH